jgi:hypothetical protein
MKRAVCQATGRRKIREPTQISTRLINNGYESRLDLSLYT